MGREINLPPLYTMVDENLVSLYYEKLGGAKSPGAVLATFFSSLFGIQPTRTHIVMFQKLSKAYGRSAVFLSILDVYGMENVNLNKSLYPIFSYFLKKRFEHSRVDRGVDLNLEYESRLSKLQEKELDTVRGPFDE